MSARDTIERELFEICGAPEYGVDTETTANRIIAALSAAGYKIVSSEPTETMVEAIRHAMAPEKFVSHMRAIDCWSEGWHAADPKTPSNFQTVGSAAIHPAKENETK